MSSWLDCTKIEGQGRELLFEGNSPIQQWATSGVFIDTNATIKGEGQKLAQRRLGDYFLFFPDGTYLCVEIKTEEKYTGNIFWEEFSNLYFNVGWSSSLECVWLIHCWLDHDYAYAIPFQNTRRWLRTTGNKYRVAVQSKRQQSNVSSGRLVKLADIPGVVKFKVK